MRRRITAVDGVLYDDYDLINLFVGRRKRAKSVLPCCTITSKSLISEITSINYLLDLVPSEFPYHH